MKTVPITVRKMAEELGCELIGNGEKWLTGVETISGAQQNDLAFLANKKYAKYLPECAAAAIIIDNNREDIPEGVSRLITENPYDKFRRSVQILYGTEDHSIPVGIGMYSVVQTPERLGKNVRIGNHAQLGADVMVGENTVISHGACIGSDVIIGKDCVIGINVSIRDEVIIGDRVHIGDGSVIAYDGFGYVPDVGGYQRITPVGKVEIEDDVHIGANCCVDRATVGKTLIKKGSKLDNLIQIAHGVEIGENSVIAAQSGISGSTKIGSWVMMGGQVGLVGHIEIGDHMAIGAQAGVTKSFDIKNVIAGYPARPIRDLRRSEALIGKLPGLIKKIKDIELQLENLKKKKKKNIFLLKND